MFRKYDLVVFGASGFTGKLICSYIDSHKDSEAVKWAIAGRNYKKLKSVRNKLDKNNKSIDILVVDSFNKESIDNMCKESAVVVSIVGPYSIYGEYLIESCVKFGTHYLDLTGEPEFVKKVEEKFSKNSISSGSIILNCCGFESIPADIGTYLAFKTLNAKNFKVENYLLTRGKISGGTWASFLNSISSTSSPSRGYTQSRHKKTKKIFFSNRFKKWGLLFPIVDREIVRRTGRFFNYGSDFHFNQFVLFKSFYSMAFIIFGVLMISFFSRSKFFKNLLRSYIPSGSGPSKKERKNHWFKSVFIAKLKKSEIEVHISGGDPGYEETAKFISESALCIINDRDKLLNDRGVLTPMECMGNLLITRLENSGLQIIIKD